MLAFAPGIGVTTAVLSIFSGVLLEPLPYPNPDQLVPSSGSSSGAAAGIVLGAAGAAMLTRLLTSMLHDVQPMDGSVFAGTAAPLLGVVLLASYLRARAAGRVDAMVVLRDS